MVEHDCVGQDHEREDEVERYEIGIEFEQHHESAEHDLRGNTGDEAAPRRSGPAGGGVRRAVTPSATTDSTVTTALTRRLVNSTTGWNEYTAVR